MSAGSSAGASGLGRNAPAPTSSRTTTTASTASTSPRSRPCRPSMVPGGSSTSARSRRRSRRPCASATSWSRRRCPSLFATAKRLTDRHTPGLEQEALADLIESGAYERHVRRVRRRNGERRAALLAALSETLGDEVTVVGADAGLHVVVWLNTVPRAREDALIARAHSAGLGVYPVGPLYASTTSPGAAAPDGRSGDGLRQPR